MRIVKREQNENGSYSNQTASVCRDGWYILPDELVPEHFPFFDIVSVDGDTITEVTDGEFPAVPAEERRKAAYETEPIIEYDGGLITVDEAREICLEYWFENTERANEIVLELTDKITAAKNAIREREGA